jgi:hypothetical protein
MTQFSNLEIIEDNLGTPQNLFCGERRNDSKLQQRQKSFYFFESAEAGGQFRR